MRQLVRKSAQFAGDIPVMTRKKNYLPRLISRYIYGVRELLGTFEPIKKLKHYFGGKVDYGSFFENLYLEISYNIFSLTMTQITFLRA